MPFSSRMVSALCVDSKTQDTTALSAPWRTTSTEDLPPISRAKRINEDGFSRAGFAGEQVEPRAERGDGVIDDGVVFSAQFDEHGVVHSEKAGPSTPLSPHRLRPVDGDPVRSAQDDSILL